MTAVHLLRVYVLTCFVLAVALNFFSFVSLSSKSSAFSCLMRTKMEFLLETQDVEYFYLYEQGFFSFLLP